MNTFDDVRQAMAGKLTAAGVAVTLDPAAVAPFVLVGAPTVNGAAGVGGWESSVPVVIAATPPGNADALAWLLDQLELVLRTLGAASAVPGTYDVGGKDLPAYSISYPVDIPNPDC